MIDFGCKFTSEIVLWAFLGSLTALLTCHQDTIMKLFKNDDPTCCKPTVYIVAVSMLIVGTVMGCVIDCNNRNTFFGGFFGYSICKLLGEPGISAAKKFLGGGKIGS